MQITLDGVIANAHIMGETGHVPIPKPHVHVKRESGSVIMDYFEYEEQPRRGAFKSHKKTKKDHRHKRIAIEGNNCHWSTTRYPWLEGKVYVSYVCECRSKCTICGDVSLRATKRRKWRMVPNCMHKEYRDATKPDQIGWVYLD